MSTVLLDKNSSEVTASRGKDAASILRCVSEVGSGGSETSFIVIKGWVVNHEIQIRSGFPRRCTLIMDVGGGESGRR